MGQGEGFEERRRTSIPPTLPGPWVGHRLSEVKLVLSQNPIYSIPAGTLLALTLGFITHVVVVVDGGFRSQVSGFDPFPGVLCHPFTKRSPVDPPPSCSRFLGEVRGHFLPAFVHDYLPPLRPPRNSFLPSTSNNSSPITNTLVRRSVGADVREGYILRSHECKMQSMAENISPQIVQLLARELKKLASAPPDGIKYIPQHDSMTEIHAEIAGPEDTPYEGGKFHIKLVVGADFPQKPPRGFFLTKIFHPNVSKNGDICGKLLRPGSVA